MQFWHSIYKFFRYTTEINQFKKFLKSLVILVPKIMIFVCFCRFLFMKRTFFKSSFLVQVHQKIDLSSVQVHMVKIELSSVQKFTFWWTLNWTELKKFSSTIRWSCLTSQMASLMREVPLLNLQKPLGSTTYSFNLALVSTSCKKFLF